eukprot:TRINITY_DN6628_c0_g1_i1.p1 TRINITY_DN6628_c0_g1~~TRINITY_DN6628_c0_g1_i1.p1  ORF type:complete len:2292 (+),score=457.58 TRINITY_DN6628_c0_g1_i1:2-6877(+)
MSRVPLYLRQNNDDSSSSDDIGSYFTFARTSPYAKSWGGIKLAIKRDANPKSSAKAVLEKLEEIHDLDEKDFDYLLKNIIPSLIQSILYRRRWDLGGKDVCNKILQKCITILLADRDNISRAWRYLSQIFTSRLPYYAEKEDIDEYASKKYLKDPEHKRCYAIVQKGRDVSPYLVVNINFFGKCKGFDIALKCIKESEPTIPNTKFIVKSLFEMRKFFNTRFIETYAESFKTVIFTRLVDLFTSKVLNPTQMRNFREVSEQTQKILKLVYTPDEVSNSIEEFNLELAIMCLGEEKLESRLKGLKIFSQTVAKIKNPESKKSLLNFRKDESEGLDPEFILNYIKEKEVMERFFEILPSHVEILRQAMDLLLFLGKNQYLTIDHIQLIWNESLGNHEYDQRLIYTSLIELSSVLPSDYINHIFDLIYQVAIKDYSLDLLLLLQKLTEVSSSLESSQKYRGLDILWEITQTERIESSIKDCAFKYLTELLTNDSFEEKKNEFIESAVSHLDMKNLELITKILDSFSTKRKKRLTSIEEINRKHNLLELFFTDLKSFKKSSKKQMKKSEKAADELIIQGYPYLSHIDHRLRFLLYILQNSSLILSLENIDLIWELHITKSYCLKETEMALIWIEQACSAPLKDQYNALNENGFNYIFHEKMLNMDCTILNLPGFKVFEKFFYQINERENMVKEQDGSYYAIGADIIGLDVFWKIALESENLIVSNECIGSLNQLYHNLDRVTSKTKSQKILEDHVGRCVEKLLDSRDHLDDHSGGAYQKMVQCLVVLQRIILDVDTTESIEDDFYIVPEKNQPKGVSIQVKWRIEGKPSRIQVFRTSTTIGSVRAEAYVEFNIDPTDNIKIFFNDKELKDPEKTLGDYKVEARSTLVITKTDADSEMFESDSIERVMLGALRHAMGGLGISPEMYNDFIKKVEATANRNNRKIPFFKFAQIKIDKPIAPSKSNYSRQITSEYFEELYSLLSYNGDIAQKVWEILELIPKNDTLISTFKRSFSKSEEEINWVDVLPEDHPYQMVYNLGIIYDLIVDDETVGDNFLSLGGFKKLLNILLSLTDMKDNSIKKAYGAVLNLLTSLSLKPIPKSKVCEVNSKLYRSKKSKVIESIIVSIKHCTDPVLNLDPGPDDAEVVKAGLFLMGNLIIDDMDLLPLLTEMDDLQEWLICLSLRANTETRTEAVKGIYFITKSLHDLGKNIANLLFTTIIEVLPEAENFTRSCDQYFLLLGNLLKEYDGGDQDEIVQNFIKKVMTHPVVETSEDDDEDKLLIGLMNIIYNITKKNPSLKSGCLPLLDELFRNCLFAIPNSNTSGNTLPKCKVTKTREAALKLMAEISRDCPTNYRVLLTLLQNQLESVEVPSNDFYSNRATKSKYGYVGLKNQGATCYMNSLIQQLYTTSEFRSRILMVEDELVDKEESVLYQVQKMFAYLQESEMKYYDSIGFCHSYKDYDGTPVDTSIQMDANEFFNNLFEKLENQLSLTSQEFILKNIFGGKIASQLIGKDTCTHQRERDEPFYALTVEIQDKSSLEESLELFVDGEVLSGENQYNCEQCEKGVDTLKRNVLKELPPVLAVHLKRFQFNYETMTREKLNSECSFPFDLNLFPYTKEGIAKKESEYDDSVYFDPEEVKPKSYYNYELSGIVVHTGSIDGGHYYSFIKERNGPNEPGSWFRFDDSDVTPFDPVNIPQECFGGFYEKEEWNRGRTEKKIVTREKSKNAYMLFYRRKEETFQFEEDYLLEKRIVELGDTPTIDKTKELFFGKNEPEETPEKEVKPKKSKPKKKWYVNKKSDSDSSSEDSDSDSGFVIPRHLQVKKKKTHKTNALNSSSKLPTTQLSTLLEESSTSVQTGSLLEDDTQIIMQDREYISPEILNGIWSSNMEFLMQRHIFNNVYFNFIWNVMNIYTPNTEITVSTEDGYDPEFHMIQFATKFFHQIFGEHKQEERNQFYMWVDRLSKFYSAKPEACNWYLNALLKDPVFLKLAFITSNDRIRNAYASFASASIKTLSSLEKDTYQNTFEKFSSKRNAVPDDCSTVIWFIETLLLKLNDKTVKNKLSDQFFSVIRSFIRSGPEEMQFFLDTEKVERILNYMSGKKKTNIYSISSSPGVLVDILSDVVCCCVPEGSESDLPPPTLLYPDSTIDVSPALLDSILSKTFLIKITKSDLNPKATGTLVSHMCWENREQTTYFMDMISGTIKTSQTGIFGFYKLLSCVLDIEDSLQQWRIDNGIEMCLKFLKQFAQRRSSHGPNTVKFLNQMSNSRIVFKKRLLSSKWKSKINDALERGGHHPLSSS